jgi:hypothetical protein
VHLAWFLLSLFNESSEQSSKRQILIYVLHWSQALVMRSFYRFGFDNIFYLLSGGGPVGDPPPLPATDPITALVKSVMFLVFNRCVERGKYQLASKLGKPGKPSNLDLPLCQLDVPSGHNASISLVFCMASANSIVITKIPSICLCSLVRGGFRGSRTGCTHPKIYREPNSPLFWSPPPPHYALVKEWNGS